MSPRPCFPGCHVVTQVVAAGRCDDLAAQPLTGQQRGQVRPELDRTSEAYGCVWPGRSALRVWPHGLEFRLPSAGGHNEIFMSGGPLGVGSERVEVQSARK